MRARRSATPLPAPRRGRPALRWAARPHLDPRSRTRRLVAVFGCGARAFCGFAAGAAMASRAARRGRPRSVAAVQKAGRGSPGLGLLVLSPSAPGAQPYAARASWASSRSPQISIRPAGGLRHEGTETATHRILLHPNCFLFSRSNARDRLVLAAYQTTVPREAAGESKGRRSQRPVLGGARAVVAAPPILRRLARHQNLGPPS